MQTKLIVGLGNPGVQYDNTRHNIGFAILDSFGEKSRISGKQEDKFSAWYGKGNIKIDEKDFNLILAWPSTFMNNSGDAVVKLLTWFKLKPPDLILVHDEVAINFGKIRISFNSGAGGHHGIESIIQMLGGSQEFTRLRIGIGPDPGGDIRADFVLKKFTDSENKILKQVIELSMQALETLLIKDPEEAMNKFNGIEINNVTEIKP